MRERQARFQFLRSYVLRAVAIHCLLRTLHLPVIITFLLSTIVLNHAPEVYGIPSILMTIVHY